MDRRDRKERLRRHYRRIRELVREVEELGGGAIEDYVDVGERLALSVDVFAHDGRLRHDVYEIAEKHNGREVIGYIVMTTDTVTVVPTD